MRINSHDRIFISGHTGFGKTFLAKQIFQRCKRAFCYDSQYEHGELGHVVSGINNVKDVMKKYPKIVYQPKNPRSVEEFDKICEIVFYSCNNLMFYCDEIQFYCTPHEISDNYGKIITSGRKKYIGNIAVTQRPALCSKLPISQAEHIIAFGCFLPLDVMFFKEFLGNAAEKLKTLPKYHYLYYSLIDNKIELINDRSEVVKCLALDADKLEMPLDTKASSQSS